MELEFQLTKRDYIKFCKLYLKDVIQRRFWIVILFIILFIAILSGNTFIWWRFLMALIVSPLITWCIFYLIPLSISMIRVMKNKDVSFSEQKRLTILDEGIKIESGTKVNIWRWESIKSAHSNKRFIYFILINKKTIPIPKSSFSLESEVINFLGLIKRKLPIIIGDPQFPNANKSKSPSYFTGLICLIPMFGAVAGIVFIINGINKYKDKWFIVIGVAGILFTCCFWYSIFYSSAFGFKGIMVQASQRQLNTLMKDVEFYKIKNDIYPDSLEQMNDGKSDILIYDPLQPDEKTNKSSEYNYQKVGTHYYLFSSGVDGIPNTKDDIYPQVAKSDSSKFGLIRK